MEDQINPDDDFYLLVNGTWIREHPVPSDRSVYGAFTELQEAARPRMNRCCQYRDCIPLDSTTWP
jgi:predicted metalloendopeptidase